jgi:hypothetical protein
MNQRQLGGTAYPVTFFMVLASDHLTPATGKTVSVTLSKNAAAFAAAAGAVTEIGNGWYALAGNATDRNTLGDLLLRATASACDETPGKLVIVPYDPFARVDANVNQWAGTTVPAPATAGVPKVDVWYMVGDGPAAVGLAGVGGQYAANSVVPASLSASERNAIADAYLDRANAIETGLTPRGGFRLIAAAVAGKLSGAATTTITVRNAVADSKARLTATVDSDGNRTAITWDAT